MMTRQESQHCVAFIFARGGSKGVPRKNIRKLGGIPLIGHSIQTALKTPAIDAVVVSTDDEEIAQVARESGALVPFMRPDCLATDTASEYDAWKHAIESYQSVYNTDIDLFVSLPPTSPLRAVVDVEACIERYQSSDCDMVVTVTEASRSPYFNMLCEDAEGFSRLVCLAADGRRYSRRQDVPEVFDMTTVAYVSSPSFILNSASIFDGKVKQVVVPDERAVDIDTLLDFEFAEYLFSRKAE
ncbi:acylneuraminate cytidylyltransferase family protein [Marinobacterium jannaschii]|uniref:acylneuraminate cytidylyltransferase family protein n=1 Tax=Marinobacterium jannaschii TaxID=64970 RepID=UPI000A91EFA1|nr:acylneuraminate cytidylyltransferase family protein [Marinobacterium jannaschii]